MQCPNLTIIHPQTASNTPDLMFKPNHSQFYPLVISLKCLTRFSTSISIISNISNLRILPKTYNNQASSPRKKWIRITYEWKMILYLLVYCILSKLLHIILSSIYHLIVPPLCICKCLWHSSRVQWEVKKNKKRFSSVKVNWLNAYSTFFHRCGRVWMFFGWWLEVLMICIWSG